MTFQHYAGIGTDCQGGEVNTSMLQQIVITVPPGASSNVATERIRAEVTRLGCQPRMLPRMIGKRGYLRIAFEDREAASGTETVGDIFMSWSYLKILSPGVTVVRVPG